MGGKVGKKGRKLYFSAVMVRNVNTVNSNRPGMCFGHNYYYGLVLLVWGRRVDDEPYGDMTGKYEASRIGNGLDRVFMGE